MLSWDQREVLEKRLLVIVAALLHLAFVGLFVEGLLLERMITSGAVTKVECNGDFSLYADTGEFEVTVKTGVNYYQRIAVPKSLCIALSDIEKVSFARGEISGLIYEASFSESFKETQWRLLGVAPIGFLVLLFTAYLPPMLNDPLGRIGVAAVCYLANRWFVAVI